MKKITKGCLAFALAFLMFISPILPATAAEAFATVTGTVMTGTTSELLKLSTNEGNMEIKIDSSTDTSACKILLPGNKISVSVSHGSDEYLHAVKITQSTQTASVSVDTSNASTVTGTISSKTKGDILYLNTPQGEMEIKMDATTNLSGCTVLVADKTYVVSCARGSDAYMHAISIADSASSAAGVSGSVNYSLTPAPASAVTAKTMTVTGTVDSKTKENLLYLSTKDGEMQIAIDSNTDSRNGMFLMPGRSLTVSVYHGSDEYLHAAVITATKTVMPVEKLDSDTTATVTGTVGSKSNENMLYLNIPQGEMELKLDNLSSVAGCKVLISGKKITVTCARGGDAYMHATAITSA